MLDLIEQLAARAARHARVDRCVRAARAARTAKVPGTDKTVNVPATTVAKFKVGKALKEAVAKK